MLEKDLAAVNTLWKIIVVLAALYLAGFVYVYATKPPAQDCPPQTKLENANVNTLKRAPQR